MCQQVADEVLLTYDEAEAVEELAREYGFQMRLVLMKKYPLCHAARIGVARWVAGDTRRAGHLPRLSSEALL